MIEFLMLPEVTKTLNYTLWFMELLLQMVTFYLITKFQFKLLQFAIEKHQTLASPLFFDNLFPFQSTTPESVISDYRSQRRADSNSEHQMPVNVDSEMVDQEPKQYTENNVEFYAEIIGKLIGKVRDSFTGLISSVQQRNQQLKEKFNKSSLNADTMPMKSQIKRQEDDGSEVDAIKDANTTNNDNNGNNNNTMKQQNEKQHQQAINAMENAIKMQMTNETVSLLLLKLNGTSAPFEIELMPMEQTELNGDKSVGGKNQQVKANKIVKDEVVQVIAKRSKQKRSETLSEYVEQMGHGDLEIPYALNVSIY